MKNYLELAPKDHLEICKKICNDSEAFYMSEGLIHNFKYYLFNYRLASYTDFKEHNAREMRGLTFIEDSDGNITRFIALHKFHNINETIDYMYDDIKEKSVISVQEKLDGSLITFIELPNGDIIPKTKMSFDNDQINLALDVYNKNINYRKFIGYCLNLELTPIFEIVSPHNLIVVPYQNTRLVLLQIRNSKGSYLSSDKVNELAVNMDIDIAMKYTYSIDEIIQLQNTQKGIEGYIAALKGNSDETQLVKFKTQEYFEKHGLMSPENLRDNLLIQAIINESIDDIIAVLPEGDKKTYITDITEKIQRKYNHLVQDYIELRDSYFTEFNEDRREFAINNKSNELFSWVMRNISRDDIEENAEKSVKEYILKCTSKLSDAKLFVKNL